MQTPIKAFVELYLNQAIIKERLKGSLKLQTSLKITTEKTTHNILKHYNNIKKLKMEQKYKVYYDLV